MASVEVESTPAVEINAVPITLETPASPESPDVVEPPAAAKETPEEIEATEADSVVDLPESEDPGATKNLEDEVSADVAEDAAPVDESAADEIEIKDETEEKEEAPPAAETEPTPTAEELKASAELEGGPDPPKPFEEEEKDAEVAE